MSLAKLMLRTLTVLALLDKTLAGAEVSSSSLLPLNQMQPGDNDRPVVAVFTDQSRTTGPQIEGRDMLGAASAVTLAIEIAVFTAPPKNAQDGQPVGIPETDEGLELVLDVIERQALAELQAGTSPVADLWRTFVFNIVSMSAERGAAVEKGVKFAARRVEIGVELLSDPIPGAGLPDAWEAALALLEADQRTASMAALVRSVAAGTPIPEWRAIQGELGLTDAAARGVAIGPPTGTEDVDGGARAATELASEDRDRDQVMRVGALAASIQTGTEAAVQLSEPDDDA